MSLIKCKKCGKDYSNIKDLCPWCGYSPEEDITPALALAKSKEILILPPDERKSPVIAALFSFFFWWLALDTFYLKGLFIGFLKLLLMYALFPYLFSLAFSALYESGRAIIPNPPDAPSAFVFLSTTVFFYFICLGIFGTIYSIIKSIYYVAIPIGKFNRKYNSYIVKR